jgi:hypothetical protein
VKQIRKRLTYANVMSSLAVFLVLGGATAFAASKIGANELKANSVLTGKIKKEAVTTSKVKQNAINSSRIADGAVTTSKLADVAVATGKIATGAVTTGKIADDAVTGAKVNEGSLSEVPSANVANSAGSAQPQVFAKIEGNGDVAAGLSKGLSTANVTHTNGTGVYCVTVPAFDARGAVANTQFGGTYGAVAQTTVGGTGNCPSPAVQVITSSGGAPNDFTFYIVLYH